MINYHNRKFRPYSGSENSETTSETIFHYKQKGHIITCAYQDENIAEGHLIGVVDNQGNINMSYHQINQKGELMTGVCKSKPEIDSDGKITLHETWQWTSGDKSSGHSILKEI